MTRNWERREKEFLNGAYFLLKKKEYDANLQRNIQIGPDVDVSKSVR